MRTDRLSDFVLGGILETVVTMTCSPSTSIRSPAAGTSRTSRLIERSSRRSGSSMRIWHQGVV